MPCGEKYIRFGSSSGPTRIGSKTCGYRCLPGWSLTLQPPREDVAAATIRVSLRGLGRRPRPPAGRHESGVDERRLLGEVRHHVLREALERGHRQLLRHQAVA